MPVNNAHPDYNASLSDRLPQPATNSVPQQETFTARNVVANRGARRSDAAPVLRALGILRTRNLPPGKIFPELKLLKNSTLILNDLQLSNQNP